MADDPNANKPIPHDAAAWWARVEGYLNRWKPELKAQKDRVTWLSDTAGVERHTVARWAKGDHRPKWFQVHFVVGALAKAAQPQQATAPTIDELLLDLPPYTLRDTSGIAPSVGDRSPSACGPGDDAELLDELLEFLLGPPDKTGKRLPSALAAELRRRKYGDDPETIARALLAASAQQIAADLADIVINKPGDLRERARAMLWFLLPHAADIAGTVAKARESAPGSPIELVLATKTLGEIAVAGVASRPCEWAPEGTQPEGTRHVPMPSSALGAFFDTKGRLIAEGALMKVMRKDAVENLLRERRAGEPRVPSDALWSGIAKEYPDEARRHDTVRAELEAGGRYMLVIDADLGERSQDDIEAAWQVTQRALKEALPGLLLVRLKGDKAQFKSDQKIVPHVRRARDGRL